MTGVPAIAIMYCMSKIVRTDIASTFSKGASQDDRLKKFAYTTVHNFQEPVRMVSLYTEILQSASAGKLDGDALQAVNLLQKAALQMKNLLGGLAELLVATDHHLRTQTMVHLSLPLRQALLHLDLELKSAQAKISYGDLPSVSGDFDCLQLVFQHLIGNAVRYRTNVTPEISISARRADHEWVLTVQDNGPGIAPEYHANIFEPYTRLHGRNIPGNGLGLAICQAIVETHLGKLWVESQPGKGSTFCFTLPAQS